MIQVPDPGAAIRKFEEFWTVANLARWDFRLNQMLALYVQKYSELLKIEDPSSKGYLDRTAATGKEFQKVYGDTTKHLATTKPGSKEFPGFGPDEWRRNFDADYDKLMRFTVVVPGVINENARNRIKGQMESDWKNLEAQILAYAYLVVPDPQNPSKKSWSPDGGGRLADARRGDRPTPTSPRSRRPRTRRPSSRRRRASRRRRTRRRRSRRSRRSRSTRRRRRPRT